MGVNKKESNEYQVHGFQNREAYLEYLSQEHDIPIDTVLIIADMLGPEEDFDGLVAHLIYSQGDF